VSRSKRKKAWRLSQIAKTGQAIGGGCWIIHMPQSAGDRTLSLFDRMVKQGDEEIARCLLGGAT